MSRGDLATAGLFALLAAALAAVWAAHLRGAL